MSQAPAHTAPVAYPFRALAGWAIYDWACTAYAVCVLTVFTPIFFKSFWSAGTDPSVTTLRWGVMQSLISAVVAIAAPFLGAIADRAQVRKGLLLSFAGLGVVTTVALAAVARGQWLWAAALYVLSGIGYAAANIFYDALLVRVAAPADRHKVSAYAYSAGYLGGGLFLVVGAMATIHPEWFGQTDKATVVRGIFIGTGLWWALFTLPLLWWVHDVQRPDRIPAGQATREGFQEVLQTVGHLRQYRTVLLFLAAYWLYIDGVGTIIRMAVDYGATLHFKDEDMIKAVLITQFVGFPAAIFFAWLGTRLGARRSLLIGISVYAGLTIFAFFMTTAREFYYLAATVGLVQGGVQALSRSFYSHLIPAEKASEFFGLYNLLGKAAAVIGPLLMGGVTYFTKQPQYGILSIIVLFIAGGAVLWFVPEPEVSHHGGAAADPAAIRGGH